MTKPQEELRSAGLDKDRELLDAFRRGDPPALSQVYNQHVGQVATAIRQGAFAGQNTRIPGAPRSEWQDLIQETFARAFSERARLAYDGLRPYAPYLMTICRHLLADYWRKRGQTPPPTDTPAPDDEPFAIALVHATESYVQSLAPELRALHTQRFVENASQNETAAALALTRQKVRTLERKLLDGLRRFLRKKGQPV